MSDRIPPAQASDDVPPPSIATASLSRISTFLLVFGAITLFLSFYLIAVQTVERYLQLHFQQVVERAVAVEVSRRPPGSDIRRNLIDAVDSTEWVQFWGARVDVSVLAADASTWLYVNGQAPPIRYPDRDPEAMLAFHEQLLPATAVVRASIGHNTMLSNSILTTSAVLLFIGLFVFNRHVARLQDHALDEAVDSRDRVAGEARRIQKEIDQVRAQLREVEPTKQEHREEIARLQSEQRELLARVDTLAAREQQLRGQAERAGSLEEDSRALEELLEEATQNLDERNAKIRELEKRLKREGRGGGGRSRESDTLARRLSFLYPNVEVDPRAVDDLISIGDESARLRAEECIKRLSDDADNLPVRRKVTGLPSHLSIYEMGFAGKRRLYFARVPNGRYRVLIVGAKNTQLNDLDSLARIPRGELD